MRKLTVTISDELDQRLRDYVSTEFDNVKGGLSIVAKKALEKYLDSVEKEQK
jgi:hypothetical protein